MNPPQKTDRATRGTKAVAALLAASMVFAACGSDATDDAGSPTTEATTEAVDVTETTEAIEAETTVTTEAADATDTTVGSADSNRGDGGYTGSYTLDDAEFGTQVTVTVDGSTRTIVANALPDHETGEFPTEGNPNTISAQDVSYEYTTQPVFTGDATESRTTGVAVNGVKFEPGTAETVSCDSGETFRVEALQDIYNLGLDFNNAHVQPTGEYHYHGASAMLAEAYATDDDLVHIGFAADGYLMYYSKSGAYESGYELSTDARSGTDCSGSTALRDDDVEVEGTAPDGTYTSDWVWSDGGDLDACNGTEIDGTYAYIVTDDYPYISRCLNGEVSGNGRGAGGRP